MKKIKVRKTKVLPEESIKWHSKIWHSQFEHNSEAIYEVATKEIPPYIHHNSGNFVGAICASGSCIITPNGESFSRAIKTIRKKEQGYSADMILIDENGHAVIAKPPFEGHKFDSLPMGIKDLS